MDRLPSLIRVGRCRDMQVPSMAARTVLRNADVPIGASLVLFAQWLGGAIFVSVGETC